jgi:predicted nucleic acid-binding protein
MPASFFDANVVLYLTDSREHWLLTSRTLIQAGGVISVQVLNETTRTLRHPKFGYRWDQVSEFLEGIRAKCDVVPLTVETHDRALAYAEQYQLGIFDANIVAAAVLAGCTTLYSEDMHNGLIIDGLTIRNPFAAAP